MENTIVFYAIYDHPSDFPNEFVVRRWQVSQGNPKPVPDIGLWARGISVESCRVKIPHFSYCFPHQLGEDPSILETWMEL